MHAQDILDFDVSRSLKVKCDSAIGLPISGFLVVFKSNIWPNLAPLQDIGLQILSDLDPCLSRLSRSNVITQKESPYFLSY